MTTDKQKPDGITLKMVSDVAYVSPLAEALHALCLYATGSESCALDVQRAAVEALNNVILHAYNNQAGKDITVRWRQEHKCLYIEIIDYGLSMTSLPEALLPSYDAENGRGWWIINACVDEYYYQVVECIKKGRNYTNP